MTRNAKFQTFEGKVREMEKVEFPKFKKRDIYAPSHNIHFYFAPSWHFKSGLLTEELTNDIRDNKRQLLSVGSGAAYLERFLTKRLAIDSSQIVLSDISPIMPSGFERFVFDMHKTWPNFKRKFDYVIFPESVLVNILDEKCYMKNDFYAQMLVRQNHLYHLIKSSLKVMNPHGQMRMNGHCQLDDNINAVERRLKEDPRGIFSGCNLSYDRNLIVVKN
jgi:hypothetical protein